jgi:hypothetical protein
MKTTTLMAVMAILFLLSCQKTSRNSTEETALNITAPSGTQIANSAKKLQEQTASMLTERFGIHQNSTVTSIDYLPVAEGYAATITFQLDDGQTGSYAVISGNNLRRLTPSSTSFVITPGSENFNAAQYLLVCTGTCSCRAAMSYNRRTGDLSYSCGCDECTGTIYPY